MGGVEMERADTGESLTCSDLPTLGGEMLCRSLAIVPELIEFCRLRDRCVRTEAGEGAVAAGGSEGDLKRLAGNPSAVVVVLFVVLGEAIWEKGRTGQKSVVSLRNNGLESQNDYRPF